MDVEVGTVWRAAAITTVGGTVAAISGALIASGSANDVGRGYAMRIAVMSVVVIAVVVVCAGRSVRIDRRTTFLPSVMAGSAIGFVLDPATWTGHAYVAQLAFSAGAPAAVVDVLVLLVLTGTLAATLGARLLHTDEHRSLRQNSYVREGWRS